MGKIKKLIINKDVHSCFDCFYRGIDGGPGPAIVCNHPQAPDQGHIIDNMRRTIPDKCPLPDSNTTPQRKADKPYVRYKED